MWFSNIYLKTLRDQRLAIGAWGLGLGAIVALSMVISESQFSSPEARASLEGLARSFAWLADPVELATPGGFVTWRLGMFLAILPAIWALLAGSRTLRGEEEQGSLDILLSTPHSRSETALEKLLALLTGLLLMGLLISIAAFIAGTLVQAGLTLTDTVLAGLNIVLHASVFASLALLISQFTRERAAAAGATGAVLAIGTALAAFSRTIPQAASLRWLSPFHYYELSKPLIPSFGTDPTGMLMLLSLTAAFSAAGIALFFHCDIGEPVSLFGGTPQARTSPERRIGLADRAAQLWSNDWSLRSLYARSFAIARRHALWWALVITIYVGLMTSVAGQVKENLSRLFQASDLYSQLSGGFGGGDLNTDTGFLSLVVFSFLPLLIVAFAAMQAGRWASDEEDGRLELVLATPHSRPYVMLAGFAALATGVLAIVVIAFAAIAVLVNITNLAIEIRRLAAATLAIVPLALVAGAVGYLLSGWLRASVVTGMLTLLLIVSFLLSFLGPALRWPESILQLSIFEQYGTPITSGVDPVGTLRLTIVGAIALTAATLRFARKDLGR